MIWPCVSTLDLDKLALKQNDLFVTRLAIKNGELVRATSGPFVFYGFMLDECGEQGVVAEAGYGFYLISPINAHLRSFGE